jgi:hypothetical protein
MFDRSTPLECPEEWMYPPLPSYHNNNSERNTYNCMARVLDDGIGNVTKALKAAGPNGLWDETLMLFSADNGGWVGNTGSNNWPLRGSKVSDFEGGVRTVAFLAGGYLPAAVRGGSFSGYIAVADWYGTLSTLVGVPRDDPVPGLPPVDSVVGLWDALMVPNGTTSPRTELLLSYSCTTASNASGCDPEAISIYNTSGDPTGGQSHGDMAFISGNHKIIFGAQQGRGIWFGPVYPNGTKDHPAYPCVDGCLFDIVKDPTEHVNLKESLPALFESMRVKLLAEGKTLYQTNYAEPGTGPVKSSTATGGGGSGVCISGSQAREYYAALNVQGQEKAFLGPMCFKPGELPPLPPPPPPPPPGFRLTLAKGAGCLSAEGKTKSPITLSTSCGTNDTKQWHFVTPHAVAPTDSAASDSVAVLGPWLAWEGQGPTSPFFAKVNESAGPACKLGYIYSNPDEPASGATSQGFTAKAVRREEQDGGSTAAAEVIQLVSSSCPGMCLSVEQEVGGESAAPMAHLAPCASAAEFTKEA